MRTKKILGIVGYVFLALFFILAICSVCITVASKKDADGAANIFGYQMRIVETESMAKSEHTDISEYDIGSIPKNSMVVIQTVPEDKEKADQWYEDLEPGDVLTFRYLYAYQVTITHRIKTIEKNDSGVGYTIELEGDNKASENTKQLYQVIDTSAENSPNYVIGKVVGKSLIVGFIMSVLKSTWGIIFIIIFPCLVIIALEIIKIVRVCTADSKKRIAEEQARKDSEIEELRRKLAELEKEKGEEQTADTKEEQEN